jgi:chromosome segregation ATPase
VAKVLYEEAEARAASLAHQTAVTISSLENQAAKEKEKRVETEAARQKLESSLMQTEQTVARKQAEIAAAEARLEASRKEADAKQAALQTEQARAQQLMLQVEKESKQKFFTELRAYRDMAQRGKELLDNAVTEINGKRDVTALIYVSQGKILFEEAKNKTGDLRANRTPSTYQAKVDDLVRALTEFLEASKQLRNAGAYIEEQGSAEFTGSLTKGKTALANGVAYLSSVTSLIASNP